MSTSARAETATGPELPRDGADLAVVTPARVVSALVDPGLADTGLARSPVAAAERGRTTVSRQAVERIAARLTADCPAVGGAARRVLGRSHEDAVVAARLHGSTAVSLAVRCSVPYPQPVAASAEALRELLLTRVRELTGMRVQRVDISVTGLPTRARGRRVV